MHHRCKKCNSLIHKADKEYCSRCMSELNTPQHYTPRSQLKDRKQDNTTQMCLAITTFNMLMNTVFK